MDVYNIASKFNIEGTIKSIEPFGGGHINDTFCIKTEFNDQQPQYILQNVNRYVFKDIDGLMSNISIVTKHIRNKLKLQHVPDYVRRSVELFNTMENKLYEEDDKGLCWRLFNFIEDHVVYDTAPNIEIAYEGARMFGQFLHQLSDLDPGNIVETIPDFHNIKFRLSNLEKSIKEDAVKRASQVQKEIDFVRSRYEIMSVIQNQGEKGLIPFRIVHNDTKINNVLFDKENKGLCIVDLDTIMPGYVHYDFGDGVRTCANTGEEDDADLKNVSYNLEMYRAFTAGYIDSVSSILTESERSTMAYAALLFPFIMGVRFLTDFIAGDVYYKTGYEDHNKVRAKAQLKLAEDGELKLDELKRIVKKA